MSSVKRRRRGTAIVENKKGILIAAGSDGVFLLPGGKANRHETRTQAAMRELKEETGLEPKHAKYLFHHRGRVHKSYGHGYFRDHHTVCLIKASGMPNPRHEIKYIDYYRPGSGIHISGETREIIERYYAYKRAGKIRRVLATILNRIQEWLNF
jgi:8-oxo-dGTP diphosphatase